MKFRLVLQPAMAALLAVRAGLKDAREGRPPWLREVILNPELRGDLLKQGWRDLRRVFVFSLVMDAIYQLIVSGRVVVSELLLTSVMLAFVPYVILRGVVARIARRGQGPG